MAITIFSFRNAVYETVSAGTGTGNFTVSANNPGGKKPWSSFSSGSKVQYVWTDGTNREVGEGTYTAGSVSRDLVLWNSNGTQPSKLNIATAGRLFNAPIAERMTSLDPNGDITAPAGKGLNGSTLNGGPLSGMRNRLINTGFQVNVRAFAGGSVGINTYGHDRWRGGASNCNYTVSGSIATIASGSLVQVVAADLVTNGTYTLSWTGTAQGRVDGGTYGASPQTFTLGGSTTHTFEFNAGTLSAIQLEPGSLASQWEVRPEAHERMLCSSYYEVLAFDYRGYNAAGAVSRQTVSLLNRKRIAAPTITPTFTTQTNCGTSSVAIVNATNPHTVYLSTTITALGAFVLVGSATVDAEL